MSNREISNMNQDTHQPPPEDYFRAQATWFYGESQVVNVLNAGLTFNW